MCGRGHTVLGDGRQPVGKRTNAGSLASRSPKALAPPLLLRKSTSGDPGRTVTIRTRDENVFSR